MMSTDSSNDQSTGDQADLQGGLGLTAKWPAEKRKGVSPPDIRDGTAKGSRRRGRNIPRENDELNRAIVERKGFA
jgi:hypothetical protein